MTRIHINASTPYDVVIEEGALQRITDYIKPLKPNCRVIIVSDSNVAPHYLDSVKANMEHAGYTVVIMYSLLVKAQKTLINSSI